LVYAFSYVYGYLDAYAYEILELKGEIKMRPTYTELLEAVEEIAALIYYQSSLKDQDDWLSDIIVRDIWKIPEDD
jgi:hypothetical protein